MLGIEQIAADESIKTLGVKTAKFKLWLVACLAAGCVAAPLAASAQPIPLPDCTSANYDAQRHLFTMQGAAPGEANQQCLLTVWPRGQGASANRVTAGRYLVNLSDGGDGGAGGTLQSVNGGGGGGGGGAGAKELQRVVELSEGVYKLTIGAGGSGGNPCIATPSMVFSGGPGWLGSPSSLVRSATGEVLAGTPGADAYKRPTKGQNEKKAGNPDGHGGSGPGKASGGDGGRVDVSGFRVVAPEAGDSKAGNAGGDAGVISPPSRTKAGDGSGSGGGGGASTKSEGGDGGGELGRHWVQPPERGALGSGGGGGAGTKFVCGAGGAGGNGFIALRQYEAKSVGASDQSSSSSPVRVIR